MNRILMTHRRWTNRRWLCLKSIFFNRFATFLLVAVFISCCSCQKKQERPIRVGDSAPQFEIRDMNNNLISTKESVGKPMILRFFDPYCKYCKADTAVFNECYTKYKDKGLIIVYLNTEPEPKDIQQFVDDLKIEFPVVLDSQRKVADLFRVQVIPQTIILDPQHKIIGAILGGVSSAEFDDMLNKFF